jgi:hypothetical protein
VVAAAAGAAALLRFPGLFWPVRPDEAGFILVARAWHPEPTSMYGPYFVDRPPQLIALVGLLDHLGGVTALRAAGAVAAVLLVVAAAGCARVVAGGRAAAWTAVATAAVVSNTAIDSVAVKGELLGLPLVMGSCWLALLASRLGDEEPPPGRALLQAAAAGVLAAAALGMKQNLAGGLVFGGVLLVASATLGPRDRRMPWPRAVRLGGAALAGAAVPVGATVAWALAAGVELRTLWYDVYGFRSDAFAVIAEYSSEANDVRFLELLSYAVVAGVVLLIGGFVVHARDEWRDRPALTTAIAAMIAVDVAALLLGGSFWRAYLFTLVPGSALSAAMLVRRGRSSKRGVAMRAVIVASVVSCVIASAAWVAVNVVGPDRAQEARTGEALAAVADPGDTLVVFGGRADIQLLSGMGSPYRHLWSLPMRTLDPDYRQLRSVLDSAAAPTWIVEQSWFGSWGNPAAPVLFADVDARYRVVAQVCGDGARVWLRDDVDRASPEIPCEPGSAG